MINEVIKILRIDRTAITDISRVNASVAVLQDGDVEATFAQIDVGMVDVDYVE